MTTSWYNLGTLLSQPTKSEGIVHILICPEFALEKLARLIRDRPHVLMDRALQIRVQCRFFARLNRAEFNCLDRYTEGLLSKLFERSGSTRIHYRTLVSGYRKRDIPNADTIAALERVRIADLKYQRILTRFIEAVKDSPSAYRIFVQ